MEHPVAIEDIHYFAYEEVSVDVFSPFARPEHGRRDTDGKIYFLEDNTMTDDSHRIEQGNPLRVHVYDPETAEDEFVMEYDPEQEIEFINEEKSSGRYAGIYLYIDIITGELYIRLRYEWHEQHTTPSALFLINITAGVYIKDGELTPASDMPTSRFVSGLYLGSDGKYNFTTGDKVVSYPGERESWEASENHLLWLFDDGGTKKMVNCITDEVTALKPLKPWEWDDEKFEATHPESISKQDVQDDLEGEPWSWGSNVGVAYVSEDAVVVYTRDGSDLRSIYIYSIKDEEWYHYYHGHAGLSHQDVTGWRTFECKGDYSFIRTTGHEKLYGVGVPKDLTKTVLYDTGLGTIFNVHDLRRDWLIFDPYRFTLLEGQLTSMAGEIEDFSGITVMFEPSVHSEITTGEDMETVADADGSFSIWLVSGVSYEISVAGNLCLLPPDILNVYVEGLVMSITRDLTAKKPEKEITNAEELWDMRYCPGQEYILKADINLLGFSPPSYHPDEEVEGFIPIEDFWDAAGNVFRLDGNGYKITGLTQEADYAGLFRNLEEVKNLLVEGFNLIGNFRAGAIASDSNGLITDCHVKDSSVTAEHRAGGIAGYATDISRCSFKGTVSTEQNSAGGIVGLCGGDGNIEDCFAMAEVSGGTGQIAGICGERFSGSFSNCYFVGTLNPGTGDVGALALNESGSSLSFGQIAFCYYDVDVMNISEGNFTGKNHFGERPATTEQLTQILRQNPKNSRLELVEYDQGAQPLEGSGWERFWEPAVKWEAGKDFAVGQITVIGNSAYQCLSEHTASKKTEPPGGLWQQLDISAGELGWSCYEFGAPGNPADYLHSKGDKLYYNGVPVLTCKVPHYAYCGGVYEGWSI